MNLSVLYRGQLSSCNYACGYCPFAKRTESAARLAQDRSGVQSFERWIACQTSHRWRILFTPWGEALVRAWYRQALIELTWQDHVDSVAAQTNLSCSLDWLNDCQPSNLALWATYHPTEVDRAQFVAKVNRVREAGVRLSVGMVAAPDSFDEIESLRQALPPDVYLWINPQQPRSRPYTAAQIDFLSSIDPYFTITSRPQLTHGKTCHTGHTSFTVDGDGNMRRCHFVDDVIGSIHEPDWESKLLPRSCPNKSCHCYLGLAHFEPLQLERVFGSSLLERIPILDAESEFNRLAIG